MKKFKKSCIGCDKVLKTKTKEHFWPKWLIKHTNMTTTKIPWIGGNEVFPMTATIPLCEDCNSTLGAKLESEMYKIVLSIESNKGISDNDAEIFIRWSWKMEGFSWRIFNPEHNYSEVYTVRDRALKPIDHIRPRLVLAIATIADPEEGKPYKPMGLCSFNEKNAIIASGIISSIAYIVLVDGLIGKLPMNYSYYRLSAIRDALGDAKLFYPEQGFKNFSEAKLLTRITAGTMTLIVDDSITSDGYLNLG
jgi:hypothetical protein